MNKKGRFVAGPHNLGLHEDGFRELVWKAYESGCWQRITAKVWLDNPDDRLTFAQRARNSANFMGLRLQYRVPPAAPTSLDIRVTTSGPDVTPSRKPTWPPELARAVGRQA